jgi:hypothetical protein
MLDLKARHLRGSLLPPTEVAQTVEQQFTVMLVCKKMLQRVTDSGSVGRTEQSSPEQDLIKSEVSLAQQQPRPVSPVAGDVQAALQPSVSLRAMRSVDEIHLHKCRRSLNKFVTSRSKRDGDRRNETRTAECAELTLWSLASLASSTSCFDMHTASGQSSLDGFIGGCRWCGNAHRCRARVGNRAFVAIYAHGTVSAARKARVLLLESIASSSIQLHRTSLSASTHPSRRVVQLLVLFCPLIPVLFAKRAVATLDKGSERELDANGPPPCGHTYMPSRRPLQLLQPHTSLIGPGKQACWFRRACADCPAART